jgi:hypothetical protein
MPPARTVPDWTSLSSSNLRSCRWYENAERESILEIEFHNGSVYRYHDVPESVFDALLAAPSKGKYHAANVKFRFKYRRL